MPDTDKGFRASSDLPGAEPPAQRGLCVLPRSPREVKRSRAQPPQAASAPSCSHPRAAFHQAGRQQQQHQPAVHT